MQRNSPNQLFRQIPHVSKVWGGCVGAIILYGILVTLGTLIHPALGLIVLFLCAGLLCFLARRYLTEIFNTLFQLDRACRTRLLEKYLSGDVPPEGDLTNALPDQKSDYFAVAMVQCIDFSGLLPDCMEDHIPNSEFSRVDEMLRTAVGAPLYDLCVPYFVPITDGIILLLNMVDLSEADMDSSSRAAIDKICASITTSIDALRDKGLVCGAVVSTVYSGKENIVKARKEAEELTAYAELMGDSSPVKNGYEKSELPMDLSDKVLRTELEKDFMQSVTNRNFAMLEKTMDSFIDLELRTSSRYPDLLKNHLVTHMEQMLSAFSISVVECDAEEAVVVNQFHLLQEMTSARQLREQCMVLIASLKAYVEAETNQRSDKVTKALSFIEEHYCDPGICADMIGDALGLSASYVSRLLRQNTGMGVVDYIHSARLKKAKELLRSTDMSVDDIAVAVGFSSRWTLTRSFKRYESTTPGAYREQNQPAT